jgi:3-oxoacyl-[acyl-carrier protein] reductase
MDLRLEGKKALVTGSSTGIGEAIAKALAKEKVHVAVHGRNTQALEEVVREITESGGRAFAISGDLSKDEEAEQVAKRVLEKFETVDILINNAGIFFERYWDNTSPKEWIELYNTNVGSAVRMIQALLPDMKKQKWGRIIQISSCLGIQPMARMPDYSTTKAAMINMTSSLALELASTGITANTVSPGPILTKTVAANLQRIGPQEGWGTEWSQIEKYFTQHVVPTPMGRLGTPDEVASIVTFLASPLAGYITGANVRIDGGYFGG